MSISYRLFQWSDLPSLAEMWNLAEAADGGHNTVTLEDMEQYWRADNVDPETTAFVALSDDVPIAYARTRPMTDLMLHRARGTGRVHPNFRRLGIGTRLVELVDAQFVERSQMLVDPAKPLSVQRLALRTNTGDVALLKATGHTHLRSFFEMEKDLSSSDALSLPLRPEGLELRPFDVERDALTVYEAQGEAFLDHFNSFGDESFESWRKYMVDYPHFDPALWLLLWDGDQLAAASLNNIPARYNYQVGYVDSLFVRRSWRKRGVATALLRESFALFATHGLKKAALGVDAQNRSGALKIYEQVGLHITLENMLFIRYLRGKPEDDPIG